MRVSTVIGLLASLITLVATNLAPFKIWKNYPVCLEKRFERRINGDFELAIDTYSHCLACFWILGWNDVHCLSHQAHLVVEYGKTVVPCPIIADHEKTQQKYDPNHEHIPQEEVDL